MTRYLVLGLLTLQGGTIFAGSIVYNDRTQFEQAVSNTTTQGFETFFETAPAVSFPGFSVTEDSPFAVIKSRTDYVSAGDRSLGFTWNGDRKLIFSFNPPISAFGADILDFGTCCGATVLTIVNEVGELNAIAATGQNRPRGNLQFFGVTTDKPFTTLTLTSDQNSDNDLIVFDEVAFRATPEPGGRFLCVVAMSCLMVVRRRGWGLGRVKDG